MTENPDAVTYGDPLSRPFWKAAQQHRLIIQHCTRCAAYYFIPHPFCLSCQSDDLEWVDAKGTGEIYSVTTIRMNVDPAWASPYQVAIVELDEGPRMLSGIVGAPGSIGDRVEVRWREREDLPPLPMFEIVRSVQ